MRGLARVRFPGALLLSACAASAASVPDWLLVPPTAAPTVTASADGSTLTLSNGLVSRTWSLFPFGTVDLTVAALGGTSAIRAPGPEGYITLDNTSYPLGDLSGDGVASGFAAYCNRSAPGWATTDARGWAYARHEVRAPGTGGIAWAPGSRGSRADAAWPPRGATLVFHLAPPAGAPPAHAAVAIALVFELYTGAPLMSKWVVVNSTGAAAAGVVIAGLTVEALRTTQPFGQPPRGPPLLYMQADIPYGPQLTVATDPLAPNTPTIGALPVVSAGYPAGAPGVVLSGGAAGGAARRRRMRMAPTRLGDEEAEFVSFRALELFMDSGEDERYTLGVRKIARLLAPWVTESPIFFHATDSTTPGFHSEVDQIANAGFEMIIYSFGSGFNLETADPAYLATIKEQVAYAHSKGIADVGGYDLICQDRGHGGYGGDVGAQWDTVGADGSLLANACFASGWADKLSALIYDFVNATGLSGVELDGPYGGGPCASTNHSHHAGAGDAMYRNAQQTAILFGALRSAGLYINQPDNYFYQGGQRTGIGYNEDQYSLPRWTDVTITRQSIFDGTCVAARSRARARAGAACAAALPGAPPCHRPPSRRHPAAQLQDVTDAGLDAGAAARLSRRRPRRRV